MATLADSRAPEIARLPHPAPMKADVRETVIADPEIGRASCRVRV